MTLEPKIIRLKDILKVYRKVSLPSNGHQNIVNEFFFENWSKIYET